MSLRPKVHDTVIIQGKEIPTPRYVAHYMKSYFYTGKVHKAKPLPKCLEPLLMAFACQHRVVQPGTGQLLHEWSSLYREAFR